MSRIVLITNIPAPYRVDLFYFMQKNIDKHQFYIVYTSRSEANREWKIDERKLLNSVVLESKIITIKGKMDNRYIHLPANIGRELDKIKPDVVIAWEYNLAAVESLIWCKIKHKKFIHLTDGTLYSERNINKLQKYLRKFIISYSDAYIASSTKAKEKIKFWGANEEKIFISLLTVDINLFMRNEIKPSQENRIVYVGSFVPRKGLDLLINAIPYINCDIKLDIVGNGSVDEINKLKEKANALNVSNKITWCGFITGEELSQKYAESKVFVLPTREDCFGLVLLEAFCAKRAIVASQYADGAYDIVENGINGYIVDPNDPKELGEAITKALNQDIQKGALNNNTEKFEFSSVINGYLEAIESVL